MFDQQVVADRVEGVGVQPGFVRAFQALVEFEIEHGEPQRLRAPKVRLATGQPHRV